MLTALATWANNGGDRAGLHHLPANIAGFPAANEAIESAATRTGAPVIVSGEIVSRLPEKDRVFLWALHPNAAMYREIAREAADLFAATLPPPPSGG